MEASQHIERGHGAQNPMVASDASAANAREIEAYVCSAISEGSRLGQEYTNTNTKYRALIVAPIYRGDPFWAELDSTAHDVVRVHKMLIRWGYDPKNIRVLCDICGGYYGTNYPTRENVLSSLEWLTDNTRKGDHRFFHFSGHGDRILREKENEFSQAKQARLVRKEGVSLPGDYERYVPMREPERIAEQTLHKDDVVFYNEAIITRYDSTGFNGFEPAPSQIMDSELNCCLSKLPSGSRLTCIMDCCASGRILNSNTKLRGSGLRGKIMASANTGAPPADTPIPGVSLSTSVEANPESPESPIAMIASAIHRLSGVFVPPRVVMTEDIPQIEREMDHIQAKTYVWTGCHQRQEAAVDEKYNAGLLTRVFTDKFDLLFDEIKRRKVNYDFLFDQVSEAVNAQAFSTGSLQFVQLWSSLQDADGDQADQLLKSPVVL